MKFIILLLAVAGIGGWYYYSQNAALKSDVKNETSKTALVQTASNTELKTDSQLSASKAKEEEKEKEKAIQEKQKIISQATEKLRKITEDKQNADTQKAKLKGEISEIDSAIQSDDMSKIEKLIPENSAPKAKLAELKNNFISNKNKIKDLSDEISSLEKERKKEETGLSAGRESTKAIGWRWTSDPSSMVRPMKDLPEKRTQPVRFIYGEKERDVKARELANIINSKKAELDALKKKDTSLKAEAPKIKEECIRLLNELKAKLEIQAQDAAKQSQSISDEIKNTEALIEANRTT